MSDWAKLGSRGEVLAWNFLRKNGYTLVEKNFRTRFGEIDVVTKRGEYWVFVEIKTRRNANFGFPEEAVDRKKQRRLTSAAEAFLEKRHLGDPPVRFDVLTVTWDGVREPQFLIVEDAFQCEESER